MSVVATSETFSGTPGMSFYGRFGPTMNAGIIVDRNSNKA